MIKIRQKLFPEEEKMNLAKYFYNYPLHYPSPIERQHLLEVLPDLYEAYHELPPDAD